MPYLIISKQIVAEEKVSTVIKYDKYIHWPTDTVGWFDILVGYCPQTLDWYKSMALEMRETFPDAQDCV